VATLAVACAGPPSAPPLERAAPGDGTLPSTSQVTAAPSTAPAPGGGPGSSTSSPPAGAEPGGVLRMGLEDPGSFDPVAASPADQAALVAADLLFDGLTAAGPDGAPVPALAASWQPSEDLRTWRFTLRQGARFSDGSAVTGGDVAFSLSRMAARGAGDPVATALRGVEVSAPSAGEVVVTVDRPSAEVPAVLSSPLLGVVPQVAASAPAFAGSPVGSGPFRVAGRDGAVVHLRPAEGVAANLEGIDLHLYADDADAYAAWVAGDLDWSQVPSTAVGDAEARAGARGFVPFPAMLYLGFNLRSPSLDDVRFRQAVLAAIDRESVVRAAYGTAVTPRAALVPAGVPGAVDDACGSACSHDARRARALVEAAFPDGRVPELPLDYDQGASQEALARAIQSDLAEAGIPSTLRGRPPEEFATFATSGGQGLFRLGWVGVFPTPDAFLSPLFRSGGAENAVGLADEEVDAAIDAARAEPDPARRAAAWAEAERLVLARAPVVPLGQFRTATVFSRRVQGLVPRPDGTFDPGAVWLQPR
jgi:ABC-type transport system substrate-binding protein